MTLKYYFCPSGLVIEMFKINILSYLPGTCTNRVNYATNYNHMSDFVI